MTNTAVPEAAASQVEVVQEAIDDLTVELTHEIFEHAETFVRSDNSLNHLAIFRWLHGIERDNGTVSEATIGTAGSTWLLARRLGDTLQDSVSTIMQFAALEKAFEDMTEVYLFANLMNFWRMNDGMQDDDPLTQTLSAEEMHGFE